MTRYHDPFFRPGGHHRIRETVEKRLEKIAERQRARHREMMERHRERRRLHLERKRDCRSPWCQPYLLPLHVLKEIPADARDTALALPDAHECSLWLPMDRTTRILFPNAVEIRLDPAETGMRIRMLYHHHAPVPGHETACVGIYDRLWPHEHLTLSDLTAHDRIGFRRAVREAREMGHPDRIYRTGRDCGSDPVSFSLENRTLSVCFSSMGMNVATTERLRFCAVPPAGLASQDRPVVPLGEELKSHLVALETSPTPTGGVPVRLIADRVAEEREAWWKTPPGPVRQLCDRIHLASILFRAGLHRIGKALHRKTDNHRIPKSDLIPPRARSGTDKEKTT